jgi:hypothetical protein
MIGEATGLFLRNFPMYLLAGAVLLAAYPRAGKPFAERLLDWMLLLPIGVGGLWAGISHVLFPAMVAAYIGWQTSPFQFEVGMADLAIGVTACVAFWQDLSFKAGAVCAASVFFLGDAVGHVRDMVTAGNFAPGNAGAPFYMDIVGPVLAIALVFIAKRQQASHG